MEKQKTYALGFQIDGLTNSIENIASGDSFDTVVTRLTDADKKQVKKADWFFDWRKEMADESKSVFKLTIENNPLIVQGLLSIEDKGDHVFMHLIESAKFNKGKSKIYRGVPGNLVAYACKISRDKGYGGVVSFYSKTKLVAHYRDSLGAIVLFANQMIINEVSAAKLISTYFKE